MKFYIIKNNIKMHVIFALIYIYNIIMSVIRSLPFFNRRNFYFKLYSSIGL